MTIRELAETAGCSEKTVKRIVAEKMPGKMQHGKVTRFTWDEAHKIMELLPKRNVVDSGQMSSVQVTNVPSGDTAVMLAKIAEAMGAIALAVENISGRVSKVESRIEQRQALLPAPQISPRQNISKLVRKYAEKNDFEYNEVWRELYREYGYRTHSNPSIAAKNRGMSVIDYLDSEGQIETLEAVALDFLGGA